VLFGTFPVEFGRFTFQLDPGLKPKPRTQISHSDCLAVSLWKSWMVCTYDYFVVEHSTNGALDFHNPANQLGRIWKETLVGLNISIRQSDSPPEELNRWIWKWIFIRYYQYVVWCSTRLCAMCCLKPTSARWRSFTP